MVRADASQRQERFLEAAEDRLLAAREAASRLAKVSTRADLEKVAACFEWLRDQAIEVDLSELGELGDIGYRTADALRSGRLRTSRGALGVLYRCFDAVSILILEWHAAN
jgi:hypothetical protein